MIDFHFLNTGIWVERSETHYNGNELGWVELSLYPAYRAITYIL